MEVGARLLLTLFVVPGLLVPALEAAEVLGLFQSPGRSQWVLAETYLRALERRGHRLTAVTTFPSSQGSTGGNWTEILIPNPVNEVAHKNVQAFITHGGLLSTQEATARGVPLVGIPVFGDQLLNMAQAQRQGYAVTLTVSNVTEASLQWALDEVLTVPRYRENAQRLSRIFNDRPVKPLDEAVYWTEYVIRHHGAPHLRSAALDLAWYQYFLLDVVAVLVAAAAVLLLAVGIAIRAGLRLLKRTAGGSKAKRTSSKSTKRD
ncbi:UDP-glycosyltransferase UGT5-like [Schistocerca serialis cubense]|uniref:UDP-glycosyltransferase UGT5-like n=1 Tax=Schistocerca serialis cubense TaxID=2023355 RepID=UPI00214EEA19|nr:UDP-glycosyltransferase UGT5-like [Schistocerca serialis cubense]